MTERIPKVKQTLAWSLDDGIEVECRRDKTPTECTSVKVTRSRKEGSKGSSKTRVWVIEPLTTHPIF